MKDELLVEGLKNREEACLKELIGMYGKLAYSIIYKHLGNMDSQVLEELAGDTFFDLWCKAEKIDLNRGSLKNLICLIARSKALNYRKRLMKDQCLPLHEEEAGDGQDPEMQMLDKEGLQELLDVIRELKEPAGTILMLRYLYCFNIPEIADRMDMKRSQVDNYLSRGRKRLLEKLNGNLQRNRRRDHNGGY